MDERQMMAAVRELANGLLLYHATDSRRDAPGFPDLVIAGPRGVLFRELKSAAGRLRPDQTTWRYTLMAAGADYAVWRPADLADGRVAAELDRLR
jgi:hypothetical protein